MKMTHSDVRKIVLEWAKSGRRTNMQFVYYGKDELVIDVRECEHFEPLTKSGKLRRFLESSIELLTKKFDIQEIPISEYAYWQLEGVELVSCLNVTLTFDQNDVRKQVMKLVRTIEKDREEGAIVEIETLIDNILPFDYSCEDMLVLEDAIHGLSAAGKLHIVDNCSVQISR